MSNFARDLKINHGMNLYLHKFYGVVKNEIIKGKFEKTFHSLYH